MKRIIGLLLAAVLVFSLAACGSQPASTDSSVNGSESGVAADESESKIEITQEQAEEAQDEALPIADEENTSGNKTLIVYFSLANADTVDAISSATPRVGDVSSVEYVAELIHEQVDADVAKIVPVEAYPLAYRDAADQARAEQADDARPEFTLDVNPEDYDVIFVGYPIWYYHLPMIMQSFFDAYDFSGKTIIPFNNHAGSRDGGTYKDIAGLEPGAEVLDGIAIAGENAEDAGNSVRDWLTGLSY